MAGSVAPVALTATVPPPTGKVQVIVPAPLLTPVKLTADTVPGVVVNVVEVVVAEPLIPTSRTVTV